MGFWRWGEECGVEVSSQGEAVSYDIWKMMYDAGVDVKNHRSVQVSSGMVDLAERVYVLCGEDVCPDYLRGCEKVEFWDVVDPVCGCDSIGVVRDEIRDLVLGLRK